MGLRAFLEDQILRRWHTLVGGVITAALVAAPVPLAVATLDVKKFPRSSWIASGAVFLSAMAVWWLVNHRPRASRKRIGVLVALRCDDEEHAKRIRRQFVEQIRHLLENRRTEHQLELVEYSGYRAERISLRTVKKAMIKSRCQFAVFGTATKGKVEGELAHVLRVQGTVRVGPLHPLAIKNLETEFDAVMPRRIEVEERNEIPLFEGHSESLECAARYMIGLAALAAGNLDYAETILVDLHERSRAVLAPKHPALARMKGGRQLAALYAARTRQALSAYRLSKRPEDLATAEEHARRVRQYRANDLNALLTLAFTAFELRRAVKEARQLLKPLLTGSDPAPKYSEAFLLCYEGKLGSARTLYRKAFRARTAGRELPGQCAEHIRSTLALEPQRYGLNFALAVVAHEALGDAKGGAGAARAFLAAPEALKHPKECKVAQAIIVEAARNGDARVPELDVAAALPDGEPLPVKPPPNALRSIPSSIVPARNT